MDKRAGMAVFGAVTVLLVLIAALFMGKTVMSRTEVGARELEDYYLARERELTREIREFLGNEGLENSGIMLTRVVQEDGSRLYTVTVHHSRIDSMAAEERCQLLSQLEEFAFMEENCSFSHTFLLDN